MNTQKTFSLLAASALVASGCLTQLAAAAPTQVPEEGRIKGGDRAVQGEYPFVSSIGGNCGGSLISPDIVLTAEHCIFGSRHTTLTGDIEWQKGIRRSSTGIRKGPGVNKGDWAIIKLDRPITNRTPVDVPVDSRFDDQKVFRTLGWGMTKERGRQQDFLRYVDVNRVPDNQCRGVNADAEICAGDSFATACKGDSGGPLLANDNGRWVLVGLTSWGDYDCARKGHPGHYAQVSAFINPIKAAIKDVGGTMPTAWAEETGTNPTPTPTPTPTPDPSPWPFPWPFPWPSAR